MVADMDTVASEIGKLKLYRWAISMPQCPIRNLVLMNLRKFDVIIKGW